MTKLFLLLFGTFFAIKKLFFDFYFCINDESEDKKNIGFVAAI